MEASPKGSRNRYFHDTGIKPIALYIIATAESEKGSGSKRKQKKGFIHINEYYSQKEPP